MEIRRAVDADGPAVLELLRAAMGHEHGPREEAFFAWKHDQNPFGVSPRWVATSEGEIVGLRVFMRWAWQRNGQVLPAVRAVDTATHPDWQGKGIFTKLTLGALEELKAEGTAFVFNTPNDKSRPGYLKMGWSEVGRLPCWFRPRSPVAAVRMARSRVAASKWSEPCRAGHAAADVLADRAAVTQLLASQPALQDGQLGTVRSPEHLLWRYSFEPLHYRAVTGPGGPGDGVAVWRNRRRGNAVEAAIVELLAPAGDARRVAGLAKQAIEVSGADYGIVLGRQRPALTWLPVPGGGPMFTYRAVNAGAAPQLADWSAVLGDIELF